MELKKSRKILEWAGWGTSRYSHGRAWFTNDGTPWAVIRDEDNPNADLPNLYLKENLWILFEYVIPKLIATDGIALHIHFRTPIYHVNIFETYAQVYPMGCLPKKNAVQGNGASKDLSEALVEAIIKAMEVQP